MLLADYLSLHKIPPGCFAQALGLSSKSTLYKYMNGSRRVSPEMAARIYTLTEGHIGPGQIISQHKIGVITIAKQSQQKQFRQAVYCGFGERFIKTILKKTDAQDNHPSQEWERYYLEQSDVPYPLWRAIKILGQRVECRQSPGGQESLILDGRPSTPFFIVRAANGILQQQGQKAIFYPGLMVIPDAAAPSYRL